MVVEQEVINELEGWVANHPTPDEPMLAAGHNSYSPRQILDEVRKGGELGKRLYSC